MKQSRTKTPKAAPSAEPKAPSPEQANGSKPGRILRRQQNTEQLISELEGVRAALNEMVDRYRLKLEAGLIQIDECVRGAPSYVGQGQPLPGRTTAAMLKRVRELDVKPQKGRAKDFGRLQDLVADLIELLPAK